MNGPNECPVWGSGVQRVYKWFALLTVVLLVSGCSTAIAVADAIGTATVYAVETVVNTVDAITPDIVNGDDDDD